MISCCSSLITPIIGCRPLCLAGSQDLCCRPGEQKKKKTTTAKSSYIVWHGGGLSHIVKWIMSGRPLLVRTDIVQGCVMKWVTKQLHMVSSWTISLNQWWLNLNWIKSLFRNDLWVVNAGNKWLISSDSIADLALFTSNYAWRGAQKL